MVKLDDHFPMSATIADAKERLCQIVADAEAGRETIITKRNRPAAKVVPLHRPAEKLFAEWSERRKNIRLNRPGQKRLTVSQLIQESRK
jgi:prevent-host-death family protein